MCTHLDQEIYKHYRLLSSLADHAHETAHEYQWGFGGERFMDADELTTYAMLMKEVHIAGEQREAFYERNSEAIKRHEKLKEATNGQHK